MAGLNANIISGAADALLAASLVGDGFETTLADYAEAAGAKGAVLIGEAPDLAAPGGVRMTMLATPSISAHIAAYLTGDIPRDPRLDRVQPRFDGGFLADYASFRPEELERDAYYNEHLAAYGLGWHACAFLADWRGQSLYLNLKRERRRGHYAADEIAMIDRTLPTLRTAAAIAHAVLAAELKGATGVLDARALGIFALDRAGRARPLNDRATALVRHDITLADGRLAISGRLGRRLEKAIAQAVARPGVPGIVVIETAQSRRLIIRTVPVRAQAADIFAGSVALALVEDLIKPAPPPAALVACLREAFGLTDREAEVAAQMAAGAGPFAVAEALGIARGTARNHLKALMTKMGVSRQAELVALLARLMR